MIIYLDAEGAMRETLRQKDWIWTILWKELMKATEEVSRITTVHLSGKEDRAHKKFT